MKLVRFMTLVALVAMSAVVVNAGSIKHNSKSGGDPKLTINKPGGGLANPLSTCLNCPSSNSVELEFNGLSTNHFTFSTADPGTYQLFSNIFDQNSQGAQPDPFLITFKFFGGNSPNQCHDAAPGEANIGCPGMLTRGETFFLDVSGLTGGSNFSFNIPRGYSCISSTGTGSCSDGVATFTPSPTPEPSTILMFLSLGPAIGFAKKRWNSRQSA